MLHDNYEYMARVIRAPATSRQHAGGPPTGHARAPVVALGGNIPQGSFAVFSAIFIAVFDTLWLPESKMQSGHPLMKSKNARWNNNMTYTS